MVEKILILLFGIGLVAFSLPEMEDLYKIMCHKLKLWYKGFFRDEWTENPVERLEERAEEYVRKLLHATLSMGTRRSVMAFFIISGAIFLTVFLMIFRHTNMLLAISGAAAAGGLPFLCLQYKLRKQRVSGSHEGEILVTELLNNYKINYYNIQQAIEITAMTIEEAPVSKRLLFNLAKGLNKAADKKEAEMHLAAFRFELGTSWAGILTANIMLSYTYGIRVAESLEDLAKSMEKARKLEEYTKRENNEAKLILTYLVPACILFILIGGSYFFGLTVNQILYYQFKTDMGLTWFIISALLYLIGIATHLLLSKKKFDL